MALTNIPLSEITEGHLQRLIAAQASESLNVEYKRETYGTNDDQRREFLADVSSFANAAGGDLIIGMTEAKGIPTGVHPFMDDGDTERLRLEQMARDGLYPRIPNLQTRAVPLSAGGFVVVVRVPKSYHPRIVSSLKIADGSGRGRRPRNMSRTSRSCVEFSPRLPYSQSALARFVSSVPLKLPRTKRQLASRMEAP
jgi:predicted HTH transcriptional regulator